MQILFQLVVYILLAYENSDFYESPIGRKSWHFYDETKQSSNHDT